MTSDVLSNLTNIYDSAIAPDIWGETLERSASVVGAKGALLLIIEQGKTQELFRVNHFSRIWTRAPEREAMYREKYAHYEKPVWDKLHSLPKQHLILDTDFWKDEPHLLRRPDYEYLRENIGIVHKCAARLNDNNSWWDTLVIHFDERLESIPQRSVDQIQTLLLHVAKSVEMGRAFSILKNQYQAVLSALDHVQIGLCIALNNGSIIVHNEEARRILEEKDGIRMSADKKLICNNSEYDAYLNFAINSAGLTANGVCNTPEVLFTVDRSLGRKPCLVEISPLRDYAQELESNLHGALVTLIDTENTSPFSVQKAALAYKLSAAESEVCRLLVGGYTNMEIGEIRNVSSETVKSQISSVLSKTGCQRRSDIIRLVLKTTPPIRKALGKPDRH